MGHGGEIGGIRKGLRDFDIYFSAIFGCHGLGVISRMKIGHSAWPLVEFEIFLKRTFRQNLV